MAETAELAAAAKLRTVTPIFETAFAFMDANPGDGFQIDCMRARSHRQIASFLACGRSRQPWATRSLRTSRRWMPPRQPPWRATRLRRKPLSRWRRHTSRRWRLLLWLPRHASRLWKPRCSFGPTGAPTSTVIKVIYGSMLTSQWYAGCSGGCRASRVDGGCCRGRRDARAGCGERGAAHSLTVQLPPQIF